jgi:tripartite-type tricarboxylate transporter receptor subunit TctC
MSLIRWSATALVTTLIAQPVYAAGPEDFYKGKTISLVIGYSVGGGYDAYGRLVVRYLGKHIPGNPSVVAQNMTGTNEIQLATGRGEVDGLCGLSLNLILIGQAMARPFAAPPGIPADRKAALIAGFDRTMADPEFPDRGEEAQLRRQSGSCRQARCVAGGSLRHAQGRHRQGGQGHVGLMLRT